MANNKPGDQKKKRAPDFNDMILGNLKSRSGKDTNKWINDITSDNEDEIVQASTAQAAPVQEFRSLGPAEWQAHLKWVDKLFDLFQQYEVEFNRVVPSPELAMATERVIISPELYSRMQGNEQLRFSGRLHTRYWTLLILGNLQYLEGYIIPSDHFIGFEANQSKYTQFFYATPVLEQELYWKCEGGAITQALLPSFAKQLFGQLVKVAKGEASEEERFQFGASKGKKADKSPVSAPASPMLSHGNVFDDGPLLKSEFSSGFEERSPVSLNSSTVSSAPNTNATASSFERSALLTNGDAPDLMQALEQLKLAVDNELQALAKEGAKAFEAHDLLQAERCLKKTSKVKELKEQIFGAVERWKNSVEQE